MFVCFVVLVCVCVCVFFVSFVIIVLNGVFDLLLFFLLCFSFVARELF